MYSNKKKEAKRHQRKDVTCTGKKRPCLVVGHINSGSVCGGWMANGLPLLHTATSVMTVACWPPIQSNTLTHTTTNQKKCPKAQNVLPENKAKCSAPSFLCVCVCVCTSNAHFVLASPLSSLERLWGGGWERSLLLGHAFSPSPLASIPHTYIHTGTHTRLRH